MNFNNFRTMCKQNRATIAVKGTNPKWPYNYGTRPAYIVTHNNREVYFYFNNDGMLLDRKFLTDNQNRANIALEQGE